MWNYFYLTLEKILVSIYGIHLLGFFLQPRILQSHGDITITGEGLQMSDLYLAFIAIQQWGLFNVPHLLWRGASVYKVFSEDSDTHTCCRAFSSGAVITCINDIGLSRPIFENSIFRKWGNNLTDCAAAVVLWSLTFSVNLYPRSIFIHVPCLTLDNTKNRYGSYLEGIEILNYTKTWSMTSN